MRLNPLLQPFDTLPWDQIKPQDFQEALPIALNLAREELKEIEQCTEAPSFENTIEALAWSGQLLERISGALFNLNAAETNPEIQSIAQEIAPELSAFKNDLFLNKTLFQRVDAVFSHPPKYLSEEQTMLLEETHKSFVRQGAYLDPSSQEVLRKIDSELATSQLQFGQNLLADSQSFSRLLTQPEEVIGLDEDYLAQAKAQAEAQGKEGWLITLSYPSYVPFMKYAQNRTLRAELYRAYALRGHAKNENNNDALVSAIAELRHRRAVLLGEQNHAEYTLKERMAQNLETVDGFLRDLLDKAKPAAAREFNQLTDRAAQDGIFDLQAWDISFYTELLKKEQIALDDESLKPYFSLTNALNGVFQITQQLFGLSYKKTAQVAVYHPEVEVYEVFDEKDAFVAYLYLDFFPRPGKRDGAWMTSYQSQFKKGTETQRPHVSIVCNFTRPTADKPALLSFNEVTTLFHEFGHALHGMLADTQYPSLSGTSVAWDFVELPSQWMENWCYHPEALQLWAKDYRTNAPLPQTQIDALQKAKQFMEGWATVRQISFGLLDLAWHGSDPSGKSIEGVEKGIFAQTQFTPEVPGTAMSTSFAHIFQGGYAAGYYSYKWAEVLDADAFEAFLEAGGLDKATAQRFQQHILSQGGTKKAALLYRKFRGHDPKPEALLRRAGLLDELAR